jgi:gamma-glutamyltranspeptidase/glutathione hydrolase
MKIRPPFKGAFLLFLFLLLPGTGTAGTPPAAIASAHPLATQAGIEILKKGGNAFDAAVAVTAALAVVEPYSSGLGGGGFYLLHRARDGHEVMLDARERAPLAAERDMYLDDSGEPVPENSINGPLSAGIPGIPAALVILAKDYGKLSLTQTLQPAIELAEKGFKVDSYYRRMAGFRLDVLKQWPDSSRIFLDRGKLPDTGTLIRQPELAETLRLIAEKGHDGFYGGVLAEKLIDGVHDAGGIWSLKDLREYKVVSRRPVTGEYHGIRITTAAPPSSGGVVLIEMLNILEGYDLAAMDELGRTQKIVEAMRRAYRDRAEYLGDPDFVSMPLEHLLSKAYAEKLRSGIKPDSPTPSSELPPVRVSEGQGRDTTHFSILDVDGNRVAATLSINYPFGSCFVVPGTGVLLNDEMDDFSAKPGAPNVYGLVGAEANAIEPGKRMLSSMTPTFLDDGDRLAILGTPGGSRIITMLLLGSLEFAEGRGAQAIVTRPRYHHQYLPDVIQHEPDAFDPALLQALDHMGYTMQGLDHAYGNMQAIVMDFRTGKVEAASDPRGIGRSELIEGRALRTGSGQ